MGADKVISPTPSARDLQAFRVFSQHPAWVITPVNPKNKVFYEFTGTINHRFLTNQNARTILVIL